MPDDRRRKDLAKIHMAAKALGLDRATYEGLLTQVAGVTSAAHLTADGRRKVLTRMRQLGWGERYGRKRPAAPSGRSPQIAKIEALLADIGNLQQRAVPWQYADTIARRVCGVDRVEWVPTDQLHKVITALTVRRNRLMPKQTEESA
ncbi:gp16 family protein [Thioalkalivibrio sp. ALMg9]|uniref:gp16 family protein n=1 Tax=Thioalkalivibrio sp. ALMg9 TaxID=1266912 RepID=UPI0003757AD4|nr:regulatory protein GemA [Thioalkalivibrio sp. ALMg9]